MATSSPDEYPGPENGKPVSSQSNSWQPPTLEQLAEWLPQYQIEELLGRGGMGAVYRGKQVALDRPVAIKLLPAELIADAEFVARFQREARTLARMQHPGIVAIYDFGQTTLGHLYFVMEFIDGTDLHQIINGPGLTPTQALDIIAQTCDALQYAHSQGVIHRDIKPANVLLTREGKAKLADFGLARPIHEEVGMTRTNVVMGTPDYVAPEQLYGTPDHRADLYSLGVMLYQMLTGQTPRGLWELPSKCKAVDARLDDVVAKALQQEPAYRYQDAKEMKTDVDRIRYTAPAPNPQAQSQPSPSKSSPIRSNPLQPRPPAASQPTDPVPRRKRATVALAFGILLPLLAAAGAFWMITRQKPAASPAPVEGLASEEPDTGKPTPPSVPKVPEETRPEKAQEKPKPVVAVTNAPVPPPATPVMPAASSTAPPPPSAPPSVSPATASAAAATPAGGALTPDWLKVARRGGGKLHAFGNGPNGPIELGALAAYDDVMEVAVNGQGWIVRRANGEASGYTFPTQDGGTQKPIEPFPSSYLLRASMVTLRDARDGSYRNVYAGGSQHRPDLAHPRSVAIVNVPNHLSVIGPRGELLISKTWASTSEGNPPEDFFLGATAFTSTAGNYISARPGMPVRSWSVPEKKLYEFPPEIKDVVEMDASAGHVLMRTAEGKVYVTDPVGRAVNQPYGRVPSDLPPAVAVRAGDYTNAAQLADGTWIAWGNVQELVEQTRRIGPALDVDFGRKEREYAFMMWVDIPQTSMASANSDTGDRLKEIAAQFQTAYDRDIGKAHDAAVADLDGKYLGAVNRAMAMATQAGNLDEVLQLRSEVKRSGDKEPMPEADADGVPESLKKLRATYRGAMAKLLQDREVKARPYYDRYDQLLAAYQQELTQQNRTGDALMVKVRRQDFARDHPPAEAAASPAVAAAAAPAPSPLPAAPSTPPARPAIPAPGAAKGSSWRQAAEWVVSLKGQLIIEKDGRRSEIRTGEAIPAGKFDILAVIFSRYQPHDGKQMKDSDLVLLSPLLKTLERLDLEQCSINGSTLNSIAGAPRLKTLRLSESPVTDDALRHLGGLAELATLDLSNTKIDGTGLAQLANLKKLTQLNIKGNAFSVAGCQALGLLTTLAELDSGGDRLAQPQLGFTENVGKLVNLRRLTFIDSGNIRDDALPPLAGLTKLERIDFSNTTISGTGLVYLKGSAATLKRIHLWYRCPVTDDAVEVIAATFPNLEVISIGYGNTCGAASLRSLTNHKKLTTLEWSIQTMLADGDYALLANFPALNRLNFNEGKLTDAALPGIAACKKITNLYLNSTGITDAGLQQIKGMKALRELGLRNVNLSAAALDAFKKSRPEVKVNP